MVTGFEGFEVPRDKYATITIDPVTNSGINDIFIAQDRYALLATGSGIDVVDLLCGQVISSGRIPGVETTSVTADTDAATGQMYVGTTSSGVYGVRYNLIRNPGADFSEDLVQVFSTLTSPPISDDQVNDLHAIPFRLLISTGLGVDYMVRQSPLTSTVLRGTRPLASGSEHCYLTAAEEGYWSHTTSGIEASYDLISSSGTGIINVDFEYNNTSSNPLLPFHIVSDIDVSENTPNVLNFATASGDFVVEESQGSESSSQTKILLVSGVPGSAVFGPNSTFEDSGKKYVTTTGSAIVFDLTDNSVIGSHYPDIPIGEKFDKENTRDQALISGTITKIRTTAVA